MYNNRNNLLDVRTMERHLARGLISKEQVKAHLDSLEDCAERSDPCETRFIRSDVKKAAAKA